MYRDCIQSSTFADMRSAVQPDDRLFDEILEFVEIVIARDPERFTLVTGDVRVTRTIPTPNCPAVRIYFRFDDATCELLWVEEAEDDGPPDSIWLI